MLTYNYSVALPTETWLEIFAQITHIPGALTTTDLGAIEAFCKDSHGVSVHRRYDEAMENKLAISLVCSRWCRLMSRFLFEYVLIKSGSHALKIAAGLDTFCRKGKTDSGVCRWIKRVEIATETQDWWDKPEHEALIRILKKAPNILVFSDVFCTLVSNVLDYSPLTDLLSNVCQYAQLRRFECRPRSLQVITHVLSNMPALEVLLLFDPHSSIDPLGPLVLPRLKMLGVGFPIPMVQLAQLQAPSLKHVAFFSGLNQPHCKSNPFLFRHAAQLKRLHLWPGHPSAMASTISKCTSLQTVTLYVAPTNSPPDIGIHSHPTLVRVNVASAPMFAKPLSWCNQISEHRWKPLRDVLFSLIAKDAFRSLQAIGFLLPVFRDVDALSVPESFTRLWDPWMQACGERGIVVEASIGSDEHTAEIWRPFHPRFLLRQI